MIRFTGAVGNAIAADIDGDMDGTVVLFMHGGGQTRHAWRTAHDAMARRGCLSISIDARGHGDSDWTTNAGYSIEGIGDDLCRVVEMLGRPVVLVGASMGGLAALTALDRTPSLPCRGLVLVDVVPRPNAKGVEHILSFMGASPDGFATLDEAADAVAAYLPHRGRPASTNGLRRNLREGPDGRFRWHWDPAFLQSRTRDFASSKRLESVLADLTIPVLLVRGRESDVVTEEEVEHVRAVAPNVRIADISGASHMVAGDRNDVFLTAIATFLLETESVLVTKEAIAS